MKFGHVYSLVPFAVITSSLNWDCTLEFGSLLRNVVLKLDSSVYD